MKGVILAGGLGTRLYPLTHATNKHLLPVYDRPMIFYPIETLVKAGITDIMIVVGGPHAGHFLRVLRNGKHLGIKNLSFAYQEREGGIADALSLAEDYADNENVVVILGDNCTDADISDDVKEFSDGAKIFLKKVIDPHRFGVTTFDSDGKIIEITEKPRTPKSSYAVTGLYIYDNTVFDKIKNIKPSKRGELEITDVNKLYLREGKLSWSELKGYWRDAGTFDTLFEVNSYWFQKKNS
ncbi:MAG: sugar phosphate nucleotidyltransferase [Patescibacteria group bacterium]|nr:sugar phosphate nucleotidyltransferase [Patescibacteria group bacterium]